MKKILKFFGVLIIANIKKIIILVGILMISSFSYYGAVDENGEKVISFEPNATQNPVEFQSEVVNESEEVKQEETKQEILEVEEQQKEEVKPIKIEQKVKADTQQKKVETKKVSTTKVEEKTEEKEVVIKQPEEKEEKEVVIKQPEEKQVKDEIKQEQYSEIEVKIVEKSECIDNNHKVKIGNSNKWFNSQDEAIAEYNAELEKWSQKAKSGAISYEELYQKCPYGYETWNCFNCKKWTLNYYYH